MKQPSAGSAAMSEGVQTSTFGPNWAGAGLLAGMAVIGFLTGKEMDPSRATLPLWAVETIRISLAAIPTALLVWLVTVRLRVDTLGLEYRSIFGQKKMRWDEVDELYAGAVRTLLYGIIPLGTRYSFRVKAGISAEQRTEKTRYIGKGKLTITKTTSGVGTREIRFGSRFSDAAKICDQLTDRAFAHLWTKASRRFESGLDVTFGDIVLAKDGIKVNLLGMFPELMKKPIPWENVSSYSVKKGVFTLAHFDPKGMARPSTVTMGIAQIPNFQVMLALLRELKAGALHDGAAR